MDYTANKIELCGQLHGLPTYSHENHGRSFYRFALEVERLSGTVDVLPVLADRELLDTMDLTGGQMLWVEGQVRSFNSRSQTGRRLVISVLAQTIRVCDEGPANLVQLCGTICRQPTYRRTPLGREICDVMLAVERHYRRTDYLPCILWGRTAQLISTLPVGDRLELVGRLQSREYVKQLETGCETRTAYEISAMTASILEPEPEPR